ncbi:unnamed protein product [Moneuplotes crassus]|uniref:Uncharacterized protein n=1 Tax=Euplotes crassus TaxID=5936 RepID=A0AAD2D228_EUPCR|nr:unnamed protein product [Moneuplotes crassus]
MPIIIFNSVPCGPSPPALVVEVEFFIKLEFGIFETCAFHDMLYFFDKLSINIQKFYLI